MLRVNNITITDPLPGVEISGGPINLGPGQKVTVLHLEQPIH